MKLSIISPAYNEEEVLPYFISRAEKVCGNLIANGEIGDYEIIIVNDGSTDSTWEIIRKHHENNQRIKGIKFSRNFGHHSTTIAGLDYTTGDFAVFLDSDLQAQPEDLPRLLQEFKKGFDIVWGVAKAREDAFWIKFSSKIFYWIFNKISGMKLPVETVMAGCSKLAFDHIKQLREVRQFAPALWMYVGFKTSFIELEKKERFKGSIKYTLPKRVKLALVGLIGFSKFPLKISIFAGFFMSVVGFLLGGYMLFRKFFYGIPIAGYASLFAAITFFFGIQFLILGIMGEYIGIIIDEVKKRPTYIVEKVLS